MSRYIETSTKLQELVDTFLDEHASETYAPATPEAAIALGHIINLAVRCNPRQSQGIVRRNIVATAMKHHCNVTMTKETDERTQRTFNKIHITGKDS